MTLILDGKKQAAQIKDDLRYRIKNLRIKPGLGILWVGSRADSEVYIRMKKKVANELGIDIHERQFNEYINERVLIHEIEKMNSNPNIHGILVQLPLPAHFNTHKILNHISISKDVDGFHELNAGRLMLNKKGILPCTPAGCMELLDRYNISVEGKNAVIVGASSVVGLPVSLLLLHRGATPTICHIKTQNLSEIIKTADIIIAACGCPELIKADWLKKGVVILDVGINKIKDTSFAETETEEKFKIVGDVEYDAVIESEKASAISPVPGGIEPMTVITLMKHIVMCAENQSGIKPSKIRDYVS